MRVRSGAQCWTWAPKGTYTATIVILPGSRTGNVERCLWSIKKHSPQEHGICLVNSSRSSGGEQSAGLFSATETNAAPTIRSTLAEALDWCFEEHGLGDDRLVALVSGDSLVTPRWLEELLFVFSRFPDTGLAVPRCVAPPRSDGLEILAPQIFSSFECDIALSKYAVLRPNIDYEGYFERERLCGFSALLLRAHVSADIREVLERSFGEEGTVSLCQALRVERNTRIYYTPFSKLYCIPGVTGIAAQDELPQPLR